MSNIFTSHTMGGKDFSYGASNYFEDEFNELYDEIISKLSQIANLSDKSIIINEITKLRKKLNKLINSHFNSALSKISTHKSHEEIAKKQLTKLDTIKLKLNL